MQRFLSLVLLIGIFLQKSILAQDVNQYQNILDIKAYPEVKSKTAGLFSDQGAWFGFCLLPDTSSITGFGGPWVLSDKKWISVSLAQVEFKDENQKIIRFTKIGQTYKPGIIESIFKANNLELRLSLIFGEQGIAYEYATLTNSSNTRVTVSFSWYGDSWHKISADVDNNVFVKLKDDRRFTVYQGQPNSGFIVDTLKNSYKQKSPERINLKSGEKVTSWIVFGLSFNSDERLAEQRVISKNFNDALQQLDKSTKRWNGYLESVLLKQKSEYDVIAVKSVMTLISNWKKAGLDLHHDGLVPSHAVTYFDGFWAWDSWKHAVALSLFEPELAKNQIRAMFDYQDSLGMVPDCIYLDKAENNLRDTKPPLAAWAVYETFKNNHDTAFVREMLPKLEAYHSWWYKYRDVNKNGWCEYGSTDGTLEAAAWESGMDNAVRFDSVKMLHAGGVAWSMDQESVDLNGFLLAEKKFLSELYKVCRIISKSNKYYNDYQIHKSKFDLHFFDIFKGYYFDVSIATGNKIDVEGTEAFIPLWANIPSKVSAIGVRNIIMNPNKFNTFMPIPTLAADNPKLDVNGYWRGPVWLDQAWFGVMALGNYKFTDDAKGLTLKLFRNADGLLNDKPIHENYNPLTGERLKAPHFSWSACHYLLLYRMGYHIK
ncbi:MAG: glycoside hydrolase [Bacteroidales bacterium]|nr:MAG: glycoside hydrolase [Bacteroidales bacterium]